MAVLILWIIGVDEPLLQLAVAAYLHGGKLFECRLIGQDRGIIHAEYLGSLNHLTEYVEADLIVHRRTCSDVGILALGTMFG